MATTTTLPPPPGGGGYGGSDLGGSGPRPYDFPPGSLFLEISMHPPNLHAADLILRNTHETNSYLVQIKTNINDATWTPWKIASPGTEGDTDFSPVFTLAPGTMFFRAVQGTYLLTASASDADATEPSPDGLYPADDGYFAVSLYQGTLPAGTPLTVAYTLTGTAINDVDYTNLSGTVTIPAGGSYADIYVHPKPDQLLEGDETVVLTLVTTNGYLPVPGLDSALITIHDNPFTTVSRIDSPVASDYQSNSQSLILSVNWDYNDANYPPGGPANNFVRLNTNGVVTQWSGVSGLLDEVKIVTVKKTTNGFTAGDMFFSTDQPGTIGWASADGTLWTTNWITLPGETNRIRGSLYIDQTGIWNNDLIAVTGEGYDTNTYKGIWRINGTKSATLVKKIAARQLEGVLTFPNDARYGPWAGKLLTGDEKTHTIYAIDTQGTLTDYDLGIEPTDFDIVPTNQNLYCTIPNPGFPDGGFVLKIPSTMLTNRIGDVVISQAGEVTFTARLWFLHWTGSEFVTNTVAVPSEIGPVLEHSTFAPIDIPQIPH